MSQRDLEKLQGRDERERNNWVKALEDVIRDCSGYGAKTKEGPINRLKAKIVEADKHLSNIILQARVFSLIITEDCMFR